jgi:hypothetical protein
MSRSPKLSSCQNIEKRSPKSKAQPTDRGVHRLAEPIHDADLENDKSHRIIFKGWTKNG